MRLVLNNRASLWPRACIPETPGDPETLGSGGPKAAPTWFWGHSEPPPRNHCGVHGTQGACREIQTPVLWPALSHPEWQRGLAVLVPW